MLIEMNFKPIEISMPDSPIESFCLSTIIPASNYQDNFGFMSQVTGLAVVCSQGTFRYWRDLSDTQKYVEIRLELDASPTNLMFCEVLIIKEACRIFCRFRIRRHN